MTSFSFIPPESVRVIKCEMDADSQSGMYEGNLDSSSKSWAFVTGYGSSTSSTSYVGVTPKKHMSYNLHTNPTLVKKSAVLVLLCLGLLK